MLNILIILPALDIDLYSLCPLKNSVLFMVL